MKWTPEIAAPVWVTKQTSSWFHRSLHTVFSAETRISRKMQNAFLLRTWYEVLVNAYLFCLPSTHFTHCSIQKITFFPNISSGHCDKNVFSWRRPSHLQQKDVTLRYNVSSTKSLWYVTFSAESSQRAESSCSECEQQLASVRWMFFKQ